MTLRDGKPCKRCGSNDWNLSGRCRKCKSNTDRLYRVNNSEMIREKKRVYRKENKEKVRAGYLRWLEENRDKKAAIDRKWAQSHKEQIKENHTRWRSKEENKIKIALNGKLWRENNPARIRATARKRYVENHDVAIATNHRKRARRRNAAGSYTAGEWRALVNKYDNKCLCCGRDDVKLTMDHIVPLSMGGSNDIDNIQPLCLSCNVKKGVKMTDYRYIIMERVCQTTQMPLII